MFFNAEDAKDAEEGIILGESTVAIKAINGVSHRVHRGHREGQKPEE